MTNNKQQTAIDLFAEKTFNLIELMKSRYVNQEEFLDGMLKARNEAKAMHKEEITQAWKKGDGQFDKVSNIMSLEYYEKTYGGNDE